MYIWTMNVFSGSATEEEGDILLPERLASLFWLAFMIAFSS